jgi:hypothetical protein
LVGNNNPSDCSKKSELKGTDMTKLCLAVGILSISWLPILAHAQATPQCSDGAEEDPEICSLGSCNQRVNIFTPNDDGTGTFNWNQVNLICCGSIHYQTWQQEGRCSYVKVQDPNVREQLKQLAAQGDFLIQNCRGDFLPLSAALEEQEILIKRRKLV